MHQASINHIGKQHPGHPERQREQGRDLRDRANLSQQLDDRSVLRRADRCQVSAFIAAGNQGLNGKVLSRPGAPSGPGVGTDNGPEVLWLTPFAVWLRDTVCLRDTVIGSRMPGSMTIPDLIRRDL